MKPTQILASLLLIALPVLAQGAADEIVLADGKVIDRIRITSESYTEIAYRTSRGIDRKQPAAEVERVVYARSSPEFSDGMAKLGTPAWADGVGKLLLAATDEDLDDFKRATALAHAASALLDAGYYGDAEANFGQLLADYRNSRHRPAALLGQAKALLNQERFAEAEDLLRTLQSESGSKGYAAKWPHEAEFLLLLSAEAGGKDADEILSGYKDLRLLTQGEFEGIANKCALRIGRLMFSQNPPDLRGASQLFDEIIEGRLETDRDVVAGAYNGLGRVHFMRGQQALTKSDPETAREELEAALLSFLRVHVSYDQISSEQPEALYWAAQSFRSLAPLGGGGQEADLNGRRLLFTLRDRYPNSPWALQAANE